MVWIHLHSLQIQMAEAVKTWINCLNQSPSAEAMFDESVFDFSISNMVRGVCARKMMSSIVDTSYALADRLGVDGVKKFEEKVLEFNAWASEKLHEVDANENKKRKYVSMSQKVYTGKERVLNTRHMR